MSAPAKRKFTQNNSHCSIHRSILLTLKWSFTFIIITTIAWLFGCLVCKHAANATQMLSKIRCTKDQHGNNNCTCPEDPITERYVDTEAKHCEFYYLCHLGVAIKMECGLYSAFHPQLKECLPRDRIPKNVCKPMVDCPVRPNRYIEDPNDCTKFYLCYFGKHFHWSCPENTYFQPEKEECINDRGQAEACILLAKKNHFKNLGYNNDKPPPKTSVALTQGIAYRKELEAQRRG